jgi:transposase InsO family protein
MAQVLARAGLHLAPTTVRRMLHHSRHTNPGPVKSTAPRSITTRRPNDLWHLDLTTVPTALGFWTPWLPFALPQSWPFCWWVAVVVDHASRRIMGLEIFRRQPTSAAVRRFLERLSRDVGLQPHDLVTDQGRQFIARNFKHWCRRQGIRQRFGAIGKYDSLAVIERAIRTLKTECTRRLTLVPYRLAVIQEEMALFVSRYNGHRPHSMLGLPPPTRSTGHLPHHHASIRGPRWPRLSRWRTRTVITGA